MKRRGSCSATYFFDDRPESAVAHAIFADGAGTLALSTEGGGPAIVEHRTLFHPEYLNDMGFAYPGGRPRVVRSKDVRRIGAQMMGEMAEILRATRGLEHEDIRHWILHSAGRKALDRVCTVLGLDDEQLLHSRAVLRRFGNMSSATVVFVLEETMRAGSPVPGDWGVMIGLGQGFRGRGSAAPMVNPLRRDPPVVVGHRALHGFLVHTTR